MESTQLETPDGGGAAATATAAPDGLFVRKASGLVREMGWRDSLSVALSGINPATVVAIFFVALVFASNADLTWPYVVAGAIMVPLAFTYAHLVAAMPRSGGDFVYLARIFHPIAGAAMGGALLLFFMLGLGANSVFVGQLFVPQFVSVAADVFHSHALATFSNTLGTSKLAEFLTSGAIVLMGCVIATRGAHVLSRTMFWCLIAGVVAVAVVIFQSVTHSNADLRAAYDAHTHAGAYAGVIAATHKAGLPTGNTLDGFFKIMPFAATGFWGFTISNFPSGELKRAGRTYLGATVGGLVVGVVILVAGWLAIRHLAGLQFLQSASTLNSHDPATFSKITGGASTLTPYYADIVAGDPVTRLLMAGGFVVGGLMFPLAMVLVISRIVFAMSFDRLLPSRLADISPRRHAPINALLLCAIAGLGFVALIVFSTGYVRVSRNGVLVWASVMTIAGVAGVALPFRRRDLYEGAPKVISGSWLGMPPVVLISLFVILSQGGLAYFAATNDALSGGYDAGSVIYLLSTALLGVVMYAISRTYLRRKGVDLSLAMRELPPE
jgi:amino acid transporter